MVIIRQYASAFLLVIVFASSLSAKTRIVNEEFVNSLLERTNLTEKQAVVFTTGLGKFLDYTEDYLARIGRIETVHKEVLIEELISNCFFDETAEVQVSSLFRERIHSYPVREYLQRLARLSDIFGYVKVEIEFEPNVWVGNLQAYRSEQGPVYEFDIEVWMRFSGTMDSGAAYRDYTQKVLRMALEKDPEKDIFYYMIKSVVVKQTVTVEERERQIDFAE